VIQGRAPFEGTGMQATLHSHRRHGLAGAAVPPATGVRRTLAAFRSALLTLIGIHSH